MKHLTRSTVRTGFEEIHRCPSKSRVQQPESFVAGAGVCPVSSRREAERSCKLRLMDNWKDKCRYPSVLSPKADWEKTSTVLALEDSRLSRLQQSTEPGDSG